MLKQSLIEEIRNEYDELIEMQENIMEISYSNLKEIIDYLQSSEYLTNEDKIESLLHTIFICYKIRPCEKEVLSSLIQEISPQIYNFYSQSELIHLFKTFSENDDDIQFKKFLKLFFKNQEEDQKSPDKKIENSDQDTTTNKEKSTFSIIEIIMRDDIDQFQSYLSNNNKSIDEQLPIKILGASPTFLSLSMYFHASKISSFLRMNNAKLRKYDRVFALIGGDYELIHYVFDTFDKKPKDFEIDIAIQFHQNKVAMWIYENYQVEYTIHSVETAIQYYNAFMIKELKDLRVFNPIQFLRMSSIFQCYEIFTYLLSFIKKPKDAIDVKESLESSFNGASKSGCYRIIDFLIENNLIFPYIETIIYKPLKNYNPIILASKHGNLRVLKTLLKFRKNKNIQFSFNCKSTTKMSPIHFAAKKKSLDIVKFLSSLDEVNINDQCLIGWTPLHFAVDQEDEETVKFLCSLGGKINTKIKDRFGETPSDLARKNYCFAIERILKLKDD